MLLGGLIDISINKSMFRLQRKTLYIISIAFWLFAALKVLGISWHAWDMGAAAKIYWAVGAYLFFAVLIFPRVVQKNILAIQQRPEERLPWYRCFTPSSWGVMAFMMALGISIRAFELASMTFISGFYLGLGMALASATRGYIVQLLGKSGERK